MSPLRKLVEEIHRRSLWQVLGGYAVGAWIILQVIDQLVQQLVDSVLALSPGGDREAELRALSVFGSSDEDAQRDFIAWARGADDVALVEAAWNVGAYNANLSGLYRVAALLAEPSRAPEVRVVGHLWSALGLLGRGKWADAQAEFDDDAAFDPAQALEFRALFSLLPLVPVETTDLRQLRDQLEVLDIEALTPSGNPSFFFAAHEDIHEAVREYLPGLFDAKAGDSERALQHASALQRIGTPHEVGSMAPDLAHGVRAEVLRSQGRPVEALAELDRAETKIFYHLTMVSPFVGLVHQRFLRAELLRELERDEEALAAYENLVQINPGEIPYLPIAHLRRAEIHEARGETEAAAAQYARFVELWAEADDNLQGRVQDARRRLEEVRAQGR